MARSPKQPAKQSVTPRATRKKSGAQPGRGIVKTGLRGNEIDVANILRYPGDYWSHEAQEIMADLSEREVQVISLTEVAGLTLKEVGETLGISFGEAGKVRREALVKMRKKFRHHSPR